MYEIINETNIKIKELEGLNNFIAFVIQKEQLDSSIFNIIIVNNEKIKEINNSYRHINDYTDVISFALEDNMDIDYKKFRLLGDIYISIDKAIQQANEYNHSLMRELAFLSIHGILHLLGFDHMNKLDEEVMFKKQEQILEEYNITR